MISGVPFRWTDPASWPWTVYVWVALLIGGWAKGLYDLYRRKQSTTWPTTTGRIQAAEIPPPRTFLGLTLAPAGRSQVTGELRYSYSVEGQNYSGKLKRQLPNREAAEEFIRDLVGKPVEVHYDPKAPSFSVLLDSSVEALLQLRPPGPGAKAPIPHWLKLALLPFIALSAAGFIVSTWIQIEALLGRLVPLPGYFMLLHVGIFVVWFPALMVTQKRLGTLSGKDFWKVATKGAPRWMQYLIYVMGAYAVVVFLLFTFFVPQGTPGGGPIWGGDWGGFSAVWMHFYGTAFVLLYAAAQENPVRTQCVNGHPLPPNAVICSQCGQPANPYR